MNLLNFKRRSRYPIDFRGALDVKSLIVLAAILLNTGASWALSTSVTIRNDTSGEVSYYIHDDGAVMGGCGSEVYGKIASAQTLNKYFTACMPSNGGKVQVFTDPYVVGGGSVNTQYRGYYCIRYSTASLAAAAASPCSESAQWGDVYTATPYGLKASALYVVISPGVSPNCAASTLSWGPSNYCNASAVSTPVGGSVNLTSTSAGASGSATATCSSGTWSLSNAVCAATLSAPSAISATDGTVAGAVTVSWGAVANATGYDVQYRKQGTSTWTLVANVNSGWQLTTSDESTFEFQVVGKNGAGQGTWSAVDTGYIARSCATTPLNWGASNYCAGSASAGPSGTTRSLVNATAGASGGATATCNGVTGQWSLSAVSCAASLAAPAALAATDGTVAGAVTVSWGAVANATGYDVQYRKQGTSTWTLVPNVNSGWQLTTSDESTFEFQVVAKNVAGQGTWSATDTGYVARSCATTTLNWGPSNYCAGSASAGPAGTVRTLVNATAGATGGATASCDSTTGKWNVSGATCSANLAEPNTLSATQGTIAEAVKVTWSPMAGASSFDVQYRKAGDTNWTNAASVASGWQLPVVGVNDYEFRLRAVNVLGASAWSAAVQGWPQRCEATTLTWGPQSLCKVSVDRTPTYAPANPMSGMMNFVMSSAPGTTGNAGAACTNGAWNVSPVSCGVFMQLDATDGTLEDAVKLTWSLSVPDLTGVTYNVYRGEGTEPIAKDVKSFDYLDTQAARGQVFNYRAVAFISGTSIGNANDDGHIPACRAARLVGASLNADMSAINGLIEQWSCLEGVTGTSAIDALSAQELGLQGAKTYKAFSVAVPEAVKDGAHVLHLGLSSKGVVLNAERTYDVPFQLNRASIAVNDMTITYDGSPAKAGQEASSIGRFGVRMEGGSGIGFAEEVK